MVYDPEEVSRLLRAAAARQRGHADHFDWPDKNLKEWGIVQTFRDELERDHGSLISSGKPLPGGHQHMAPDYQLNTHAGEAWGVEVTELVDEGDIRRGRQGLLPEAGWSDDELIAKVRSIVAKKDSPAHLGGGPYDRYILLMHVDEALLPAERLAGVLSMLEFETRLITNIYLLVSYDPVVRRHPLLALRVRQLPGEDGVPVAQGSSTPLTSEEH